MIWRMRRHWNAGENLSMPRPRHALPDDAAVQPASRRWWTASEQGTRWSVAIAAMLIAGIGTLLWRGAEVPEVRPSPQVAPAPPPAAASSAPAAPSQAPPAAASPAARAAPARQVARERREGMQDAAGTRREAATAVRGAPPAARGDWTQVRIEADGVSRVVPRQHAGRLPALVAAALVAASEPSAAAGPAALTLELSMHDQPLGVLEWRSDAWRWVPLRDARQAQALALDPAQSTELLHEARSLLER